MRSRSRQPYPRLLPAAALACFSVCALSACAPAGPGAGRARRRGGAGTPQSQCDVALHLQDVETYDGTLGVAKSFVNRHRLAVGHLRWRSDLAARYSDPGNVNGMAWCSGTLVATDLFLTAGHCLDSGDTDEWLLPIAEGSDPPSDLAGDDLAREFVVEMRYEVSASTGQVRVRETVPVSGLIEYRLGGLDYALLRLASDAGLRHGIARVAPGNPPADHRIAVLQHPMGNPMEVGAGTIAALSERRIEYGIDTLNGSSGAGLLDVSTGKLIGIHTNGGCSPAAGGANFGVPVEALLKASDTLRGLADPSEEYLVGDWDGDGKSNIAVRRGNHVHMDTNFDASAEIEQQFGKGEAEDEYLVGDWDGDGTDNLAVREGNCILMDTNFDEKWELKRCGFGQGNGQDQYLVGDWNGDGQSDIGVRDQNCLYLYTGSKPLAGNPYCYGSGADEDEYLVGDWEGTGVDRIAVRRGNWVFMDLDGDGLPDRQQQYGSGGNDSQYLVGDWNGDHRSKLAIRKGNVLWMDVNFDKDADYRQTFGGP